MWRRLTAIVVVLLLGFVSAWYVMIDGYENNLGTENTMVLTVLDTQATNGSNDVLAHLRFAEGAEALPWASLRMQILIDDTTYGCSFGSESKQPSEQSLVMPQLGADGTTFTTQIDASKEDTFTHLSLPHQQEGNATNHTLRFSTTDIHLGPGIRWTFVKEATFTDQINTTSSQLSNHTEERLEWYTYDLAVHRIIPNKGVYVFEQDDVLFKVHFQSYYNDEDEARHPTMLIGVLGEAPFPALQDPTLVAPSPCIIQAGDNDAVAWNASEQILIAENDQNIRSQPGKFEVIATFEGVEVRIVQSDTSPP